MKDIFFSIIFDNTRQTIWFYFEYSFRIALKYDIFADVYF